MGIIHTYHRLWPVVIAFFLFHKGIYLMAPCLWKEGLVFWYSKASPHKNLIMQTCSWYYPIIQMASPCFERPQGSGHPLIGPKNKSMPLVIPSYFGSCWKGLAVSGTFLIGPWQNPCVLKCTVPSRDMQMMSLSKHAKPSETTMSSCDTCIFGLVVKLPLKIQTSQT
jgi:hypothetical protein